MAQSATEFVERTDAGQALPGPARISGGHLVTKAFKAEGVETVFTLRGGHIIDIYAGCVDEGVRVIDVRHEQVA
jgi:acetolactate synthase-1/2/3 large subunit